MIWSEQSAKKKDLRVVQTMSVAVQDTDVLAVSLVASKRCRPRSIRAVCKLAVVVSSVSSCGMQRGACGVLPAACCMRVSCAMQHHEPRVIIIMRQHRVSLMIVSATVTVTGSHVSAAVSRVAFSVSSSLTPNILQRAHRDTHNHASLSLEVLTHQTSPHCAYAVRKCAMPDPLHSPHPPHVITPSSSLQHAIIPEPSCHYHYHAQNGHCRSNSVAKHTETERDLRLILVHIQPNGSDLA
eukprot:216546-Rhodomonas_salina.1